MAQSLKLKFAFSQVAKGFNKNVEWVRQEKRRLEEFSRMDSNPQRIIHRGQLEALIDIEKKLLAGENQVTGLSSRPGSSLDDAMKILVGLRNEFEETKTYAERVYQLDKNNDLILGKTEMYPKILQLIDRMIQELNAEISA